MKNYFYKKFSSETNAESVTYVSIKKYSLDLKKEKEKKKQRSERNINKFGLTRKCAHAKAVLLLSLSVSGLNSPFMFYPSSLK